LLLKLFAEVILAYAVRDAEVALPRFSKSLSEKRLARKWSANDFLAPLQQLIIHPFAFPIVEDGSGSWRPPWQCRRPEEKPAWKEIAKRDHPKLADRC
jgi:hypothetical protein